MRRPGKARAQALAAVEAAVEAVIEAVVEAVVEAAVEAIGGARGVGGASKKVLDEQCFVLKFSLQYIW